MNFITVFNFISYVYFGGVFVMFSALTIIKLLSLFFEKNETFSVKMDSGMSLYSEVLFCLGMSVSWPILPLLVRIKMEKKKEK